MAWPEVVVIATNSGLASRSLKVVQTSSDLDNPAIAEPNKRAIKQIIAIVRQVAPPLSPSPSLPSPRITRTTLSPCHEVLWSRLWLAGPHAPASCAPAPAAMRPGSAAQQPKRFSCKLGHPVALSPGPNHILNYGGGKIGPGVGPSAHALTTT